MEQTETTGRSVPSSAVAAHMQAAQERARVHPAWQALNFEKWIKCVILGDVLDEGDEVLEISCGHTGAEDSNTGGAGGGTHHTYARHKIQHLTTVDSSATVVAAAQRKWEKTKRFDAEFATADLYTTSLDQVLREGRSFDVVVCFDGMQNSFASEETAELFLRSATCRLREGGYFLGFLPDSSAIWSKAAKVNSKGDEAPKFGGDLYKIEFNDDLSRFQPFGTSYTHRMREMEDRKQYLVHFPTLLQLARKLQLEMVEVVNFIDFYEDHKKSHEAALTEIMGWTKTNKKLFPNQLELIGLRTTFVFRKLRSGESMP